MENREREGSGSHNQRRLQSSKLGKRLKRNRSTRAARGEEEIQGNANDSIGWQTLPEGILENIFRHLSVIDYVRFRCVCKTWNAVLEVFNKRYLASKPPLVVYTSSWSKKTSYLCDISEGTKYALKKSCCLSGKEIVGLSCGYLILRDYSSDDILVVNTLTGSEYLFPKLPLPEWRLDWNRCIVAKTKPHEDLLLVVLSMSFLQLRRYKDHDWVVYAFARLPYRIEDVIVYENNVFFVTNDAQIGVVSLEPPYGFHLADIDASPQFLSKVRFVDCGKDLMVLETFPTQRYQLHKIDFSKMEWVRVLDMENQAIFLCPLTCSIWSNPTSWGEYKNCVYHLFNSPGECSVYSLSDQLLGKITLTEGRRLSHCKMNSWYFLNKSYNIDYVEVARERKVVRTTQLLQL